MGFPIVWHQEMVVVNEQNAIIGWLVGIIIHGQTLVKTRLFNKIDHYWTVIQPFLTHLTIIQPFLTQVRWAKGFSIKSHYCRSIPLSIWVLLKIGAPKMDVPMKLLGYYPYKLPGNPYGFVLKNDPARHVLPSWTTTNPPPTAGHGDLHVRISQFALRSAALLWRKTLSECGLTKLRGGWGYAKWRSTYS